jgi:hypothetical protein
VEEEGDEVMKRHGKKREGPKIDHEKMIGDLNLENEVFNSIIV